MFIIRSSNVLALVFPVLCAQWSCVAHAENTRQSSSHSYSSQWTYSTHWSSGRQPSASQNGLTFDHDRLLSLFNNLNRPTIDTSDRSVRQSTKQQRQSDNEEQQSQNQGQQFDNQGRKFDNQGRKFDNQGRQFNNQEQQFDNQGRRFDSQGQKKFDNQGGQFNNQGRQFDNQGRQFDNQGRQFDNEGRQFDNQGQQFNSQGRQFNNQGRQSDSQDQKLDNEGRQFDNQGRQPQPPNQVQKSEIQRRTSQNQVRQSPNPVQQVDIRERDDIDDRPVWGEQPVGGDKDRFTENPTVKSKLTAKSSSEKVQPQTTEAASTQEDEEPWIPASQQHFVDTRSLKYCLSYCDQPYGVGFVSGGENARLHEFPHMVALGYGSGSFQGKSLVSWNSCGGSLISKNYVLTAAHCIDSSMGPPTLVRIGEHDLSRDDEGAPSQDFPVRNVILHPEYNPSVSLYHDIALLELAGAVNFTKHMRPACLHNENVKQDEFSKQVLEPTTLVATGWGNTGFVDAPSEVLQKVQLDVIDTRTCQSLLNTDKFIPNGIQGDTQVCAGILAGGRDTCGGDSGGPLQVNNTVFHPVRRCPMEIVGITSFGKICAQADSPGVYTRVAHYVPWIENIVWPKKSVQTNSKQQ